MKNDSLDGEVDQPTRCQLIHHPLLARRERQINHYRITWRWMNENERHAAPTTTLETEVWFIKQAIQSLANQQNQGNQRSFSVQLSSLSLQRQDILSAIHDALQDHPIPDQHLIIQYREQSLRTELSHARQTIQSLRAFGCEVAVSDFAHAQGSLRMLDYLQIKQVSFSSKWAAQINQDEAKQGELRAIQRRLSQQVDQTTMTGIQDAQSLALCWDMGFDYFMGDFIQAARSHPHSAYKASAPLAP